MCVLLVKLFVLRDFPRLRKWGGDGRDNLSVSLLPCYTLRGLRHYPQLLDLIVPFRFVSVGYQAIFVEPWSVFCWDRLGNRAKILMARPNESDIPLARVCYSQNILFNFKPFSSTIKIVKLKRSALMSVLRVFYGLARPKSPDSWWFEPRLICLERS